MFNVTPAEARVACGFTVARFVAGAGAWWGDWRILRLP